MMHNAEKRRAAKRDREHFMSSLNMPSLDVGNKADKAVNKDSETQFKTTFLKISSSRQNRCLKRFIKKNNNSCNSGLEHLAVVRSKQYYVVQYTFKSLP